MHMHTQTPTFVGEKREKYLNTFHLFYHHEYPLPYESHQTENGDVHCAFQFITKGIPIVLTIVKERIYKKKKKMGMINDSTIIIWGFQFDFPSEKQAKH